MLAGGGKGVSVGVGGGTVIVTVGFAVSVGLEVGTGVNSTGFVGSTEYFR